MHTYNAGIVWVGSSRTYNGKNVARGGCYHMIYLIYEYSCAYIMVWLGWGVGFGLCGVDEIN